MMDVYICIGCDDGDDIYINYRIAMNINNITLKVKWQVLR